MSAKLTPDGPPQEAFWDRYNGRSEFPLSTVLSVLLHVAAAAVIVAVVFGLMNRDADRSGVPVKLIDVNGGEADAGEGKAGSGGSEDPIARESREPLQAALDSLPDPKVLPAVKDEVRRQIQLDDPTAHLPISDSAAAALAVTEKTLRDRLMGVGGRKGSGDEPGAGDAPQAGDGKGGKGADSSRERSLRWVLRFRTNSGRDYLEQLAAMKATVIVPLPPNDEKCLLFEDLANPSRQRMATDADIKRLAGQIKFSDVRRNSVAQVAAALGVDGPVRSFWAFFPRGLEDELARKETGYRNRRSDDIEETTFQITIRGGSYDVVVFAQSARR